MEHVAELDNALFQRSSLAKPTSEISALYVQCGQNSTMGRGNTRLVGPNRLANIQCYNCKKLGHFASSCFEPDRRGSLPVGGDKGGQTRGEKAGEGVLAGSSPTPRMSKN